MDHFSMIYELCRTALSGDSKQAKPLVKKLATALSRSGEKDDALLIDRLLKATDATAHASPVNFRQSKAGVTADIRLPGETLHVSTHIPVDRESGAPLAELIGSDELPNVVPALSPSLEGAVKDLVLEWQNSDVLEELGLAPARTCLIYGPPGTGKTQLALWLAQRLGLPVILVRLDGLMSSYLGTTSRNIGTLFKFANRFKALLLLDEFDAIAKLRDDPNEIGEIKRVVNTLLQELDKRHAYGLTVAITNHPGLLDPAVWRRFEVQLEMPMPDFEQRLAILQRYLPPLEVSDGKTQLLAWLLDGCSGAEIEDVVKGLKKNFALETERLAFVDRLCRVATAHGNRINERARQALSMDKESLAKVLLSNQVFSQTRVAEALDLNRSTVSRWAKQ